MKNKKLVATLLVATMALSMIGCGSSTQETTSDADADQEEKQKEEEAIPNAFIVQIQTDGGTVLSDSEPLKWEDTSLGKETAK